MRVFFRPVLRQRLRAGARAGVIAAAATAGVLVGLGAARGTPVAAINAVAHILIGARATFVRTADPLVTTAGAALHLLCVVVWGVLFALAAGRLRGPAVLVAALAFSALIALLDFTVMPEGLRPGFEAVIGRSEIVLVYLVLGLALWGGLRPEA